MMIRRLSNSRDNPTASQSRETLMHVMISNVRCLHHSDRANCEVDIARYFLNINSTRAYPFPGTAANPSDVKDKADEVQTTWSSTSMSCGSCTIVSETYLSSDSNSTAVQAPPHRYPSLQADMATKLTRVTTLFYDAGRFISINAKWPQNCQCVCMKHIQGCP